MVMGEGWGGQTVREFGMDMYTLLYLGWIFNKDLLYSIAQGSLLSIIQQPPREGSLGENGCMCMYG